MKDIHIKKIKPFENLKRFFPISNYCRCFVVCQVKGIFLIKNKKMKNQKNPENRKHKDERYTY